MEKSSWNISVSPSYLEQSDDGLMSSNFMSFQQYFSHLRTMGEC